MQVERNENIKLVQILLLLLKFVCYTRRGNIYCC